MATALILALTLMAASPAPADQGEPLPPGAPTQPYELSAWCYGALQEYLTIYDVAKPDIIAIDREFGPPDKEAEPYHSDILAARRELKQLAGAVTAAEKASPQPISDRGVAAIRQGRGIWAPVEGKTRRELARAWMAWGLPDQCDSTSRELAARSALLGQALSYNEKPSVETAGEAEPPVAQPEPEQGGGAQTMGAPQPNGSQAYQPAPEASPSAGIAADPGPQGPAPASSEAADQAPAAPPPSRVVDDVPPSAAAPPPSQSAASPKPAQAQGPTPAQPTDQSSEPTL